VSEANCFVLQRVISPEEGRILPPKLYVYFGYFCNIGNVLAIFGDVTHLALRPVTVIMTNVAPLSGTAMCFSPVRLLLPFPPVSVIPPMLCTDLPFNTALIRRTSGLRPGTFQRDIAVCNTRDNQTKIILYCFVSLHPSRGSHQYMQVNTTQHNTTQHNTNSLIY
jgi:hypothetical protein